MKKIFKLICLLVALSGQISAKVIEESQREMHRKLGKSNFFVNLERKLRNESSSDEDRVPLFGAEYMGKTPLNFSKTEANLRKELESYLKNNDSTINKKSRENALLVYISNVMFIERNKEGKGSGREERRMNLVPNGIFTPENSSVSLKNVKKADGERRLKQVRKPDLELSETLEDSAVDKLHKNLNMFELAKEGKLFEIDEQDMYDIGNDDITKFHGVNVKDKWNI